ncbi:maltokinase N-terminal cap-like domain-containing protein [Streptomyces sp. NBC_00344]|uniref:maltokinase N-terminal cap-like domain-containing protein n=1 Tax=Streptomyces sp. NBC_00344 TaxID=2975720 RepID=UPI002E1D5B13
MSVIHRTTLTPTKLELLTSWLPQRPWYVGDREPELAKAGGFRLDDPQGEIGMEFMAVTDTSGDRPVTYHVPLTYRSEPVAAAGHALVGTTEHGVLGQRWVYDGTQDTELVAELFALMAGAAEPQMQSTSHTPDPSVTGWFAHPHATAPITHLRTTHAAEGSDAAVTAGPGGSLLNLHFNRVLHPGQDTPGQARGHVTAGWQLPDGTTTRGLFATVHTLP